MWAGQVVKPSSKLVADLDQNGWAGQVVNPKPDLLCWPGAELDSWSGCEIEPKPGVGRPGSVDLSS